MKKRNSLLTKLRGRKINNTFWLGNLVCNSPKKHIILHSKYRSTMSDDLFEHILTILSGKQYIKRINMKIQENYKNKSWNKGNENL